MESKKVEFTGSRQALLAANLDLPDTRPRAYAVFAHCFTCSKDVVAAARISRALTRHGIGVLRFDFTGLGHSGGEFGNTDFSSNVEDLVRAAGYLRDTRQAPTILIGHSLGGSAVIAAAHLIPETRAVATIGAPADPSHVAHLLGESREEIERNGEADVRLGGRSFRVRKEFLDDLAAQPQAERIARLGAALLVMHSPVDQTVGVENARLIFDAARHPKSFVALDRADHFLSRRTDSEFVADVLATWAGRYVGEPGETAEIGETGATGGEQATTEPAAVHGPGTVVASDAGPADGTDPGLVVVSESVAAAPFGQTVTVGPHAFRADEPRPVGSGTGPNPYDLLLAGLGACTTMTVRMYARRKQWPLDHVSVSLRHSRIHAEDCADCETKTGRLDRIERTIRIEGDLDDAQRKRLLEIADKCPVHRTLRSEVVIDTVEATGGGEGTGGTEVTGSTEATGS